MFRFGIIPFALLLGFSPNLKAGTKLSKAAIQGDVSKIQTCLSAGEMIDEIDKWGWTPLMWAVYYKYIPATQCLLEHKANPNIQSIRAYGSIPKQSTPLIICAYQNMEEHARMLLKAGADPNITNEKGKKALDYAQEFSFQEIIDLLTKDKARKEVPKAQPRFQTPPPPQRDSPPKVQPPQGTPPVAQPAAPKKPTPPKKKEAPKKSEPPAIK